MLKEKKELESLANFCIDNSIKSGATDCEVKIGNIISETANLRNKRIENSDRSDILSINIKIKASQRIQSLFLHMFLRHLSKVSLTTLR